MALAGCFRMFTPKLRECRKSPWPGRHCEAFEGRRGNLQIIIQQYNEFASLRSQ